MDIFIKPVRCNPYIYLISQAHEGEWFDLPIPEDVSFREGEQVIIPFGICVQLPSGHEAIIKPRSSTFRKYGLIFADSGVIDNAYCGDNDEWSSTWYATRSGSIEQGTRIAQFRLLLMSGFTNDDIRIIDKLNNSDRGGYGSTGD